jgi:hypothetical protein
LIKKIFLQPHLFHLVEAGRERIGVEIGKEPSIKTGKGCSKEAAFRFFPHQLESGILFPKKYVVFLVLTIKIVSV